MSKTYNFQETLDKHSKNGNTKKSGTYLYVHQDQLNLQAFPERLTREKPELVLIESITDASSLPFHKKKLILEWSARRHFALEAVESGFPVTYLQTDKTAAEALRGYLESNRNAVITCMQPAEYTPRKQLEALNAEAGYRFEIIPNHFFIADPSRWSGKVQSGYRMEYFYREMRRQTGYLMKGGKPVGGKWNFDDENRQPFPDRIETPSLTAFTPDEVTRDVIMEIEDRFPKHFGLSDGFAYAVTREQALEVLDDFIANRLSGFGPYQDAMAAGEPFLFHSLLSPYLNLGILTAREVCEAALEAYEAADESVKDKKASNNDALSTKNKLPLNSVEGFVRQILGWREYIRIYYEAMMPEVRKSNFFLYDSPLPELYWSADTNMKCLRESVQSVREHGYAHHIQRLMVLSNFSNLTESDPYALFKWFWLGFVDAHEWVVLPNVLGMSTFADGGVLASKPYIAGGNYIRKMSDYCSGCRFRVQDRTGKDACPFNYLYWSFIDREQKHLNKNPRIGFMLKTWNKKSEKEKEEVRMMSGTFVESLKRYDQKNHASKKNS